MLKELSLICLMSFWSEMESEIGDTLFSIIVEEEEYPFHSKQGETFPWFAFILSSMTILQMTDYKSCLISTIRNMNSNKFSGLIN